MSYVIAAARAAIGLVIILVFLALIGISPSEAGSWVGDVLDSLGDFFASVRANNN